MGQKGDKHTPEAQFSCEAFIEKLSTIKEITSKKMFGGHGIFHKGKMFGIIDSKGQAYLKTDKSTATLYIEKGSVPHGKMPYHSVPDSLLADSAQLVEYAKKSIALVK